MNEYLKSAIDSYDPIASQVEPKDYRKRLESCDTCDDGRQGVVCILMACNILAAAKRPGCICSLRKWPENLERKNDDDTDTDSTDNDTDSLSDNVDSGSSSNMEIEESSSDSE